MHRAKDQAAPHKQAPPHVLANYAFGLYRAQLRVMENEHYGRECKFAGHLGLLNTTAGQFYIISLMALIVLVTRVTETATQNECVTPGYGERCRQKGLRINLDNPGFDNDLTRLLHETADFDTGGGG
jgi:hypothetical protein